MQVFPHTTLWLSPLKFHALLVGSMKPLQIDAQELRRKLERPGVRQDMVPAGVAGPLDFLAGFVMGEGDLHRFVGSARLNTDDRPYLEFTPSWSYFLATRYALQNLNAFQMARKNVLPLLANRGSTPNEVALLADSVTRRYEATQRSLNGDILFAIGRKDEAWKEWTAALAIDTGDSSATRGMRRATGMPERRD